MTVKSSATIKSILTDREVAVALTDDATVAYLDINAPAAGKSLCINVPAPELLDALGAVPKDTPYAELAEQLHAATQRAEGAEAEALEQASLVRTFADRAEAAEARLDGIDKLGCGCEEADEHLDAALKRAEKAEARLADLTEHDSDVVTDLTRRLGIVDLKLIAAEATIQRVREYVASHLDPHHQAAVVAARVAEGVRAILDPVPPFTLPTTVPASITATPDFIGAEPQVLTLVTDGRKFWWCDYDEDLTYSPEQVLEEFTDHRLIGADE